MCLKLRIEGHFMHTIFQVAQLGQASVNMILKRSWMNQTEHTSYYIRNQYTDTQEINVLYDGRMRPFLRNKKDGLLTNYAPSIVPSLTPFWAGPQFSAKLPSALYILCPTKCITNQCSISTA